MKIEILETEFSLCGSGVSHRSLLTPDDIVITLPCPGAATQEERVAVLCHELGHVVGEIMGLPAAVNDPRLFTTNPPFPWPPEVIASEDEAWRVGEQIFQELKRRCLKSYRDHQEEPHVARTEARS